MTDVPVIPKVAATELKKAFQTGAIPTETNYIDLINLADIGRQAVGLTDEMVPSNSSATGLIWAGGGPLKIHLPEGGGGLQVTEGGLSVRAGAGLVVDETGVAVRATGALKVDGTGLGLCSGSGLMQDDSGLALDLDSNGGLEVGGCGLGVKLAENASGLSLSKVGGLGIAVDGQFLQITEKGLALTSGALAQAVKDIGGALTVAIDLLKNYKLEDEESVLRNGSKAVQRLQRAFLDALASASAPDRKGWAASMSVALDKARAEGQSLMVRAMWEDATRRGTLKAKKFYSADMGQGMFLSVRDPKSTKSIIDAEGCIVVFVDKTATVAEKLYVGFGGYYLSFADFKNSRTISDVSYVLLPGVIDGKSVIFEFELSASIA